MNEIMEAFVGNNFYNVATVTDDSVDYRLMLRLEKRGKTVRPTLTKYDKLTNMLDVYEPYHTDKRAFYTLYTGATRKMQLEMISALQEKLGLVEIVCAINVYSRESVAEYCRKILETVFVYNVSEMTDEFVSGLSYKPVYERNMMIAVCKHLEVKVSNVNKTA